MSRPALAHVPVSVAGCLSALLVGLSVRAVAAAPPEDGPSVLGASAAPPPAVLGAAQPGQDSRDDDAETDDADVDASEDDGADASGGAENRPLLDEPEITPELLEAVRRGLVYLAEQQNEDGTFGTNTRYGKNVGITGLCALAFMADGHVPGRGEYGEVVSKALDFVLDHATETGLIVAQASHGPMYGHGFATLFLGEVYGMGGAAEDPRLREALVKAVRLIVKTQNEDGGWRYNPLPDDADVSVTICQIMALRSARNAGIKVPKETIDRAVRYVRACQNDDGGFRYMIVPGASAWPRSGAGVASLFYAGIYEGDDIERGLAYLRRFAFPSIRRPQAHYYYGNYYVSQAMYLAGGEHWARWWPACRADILGRQDPPSGGWLDHFAGGPYGTAMACIVLQMPKRYLPIFQR